jgi:TIR domain
VPAGIFISYRRDDTAGFAGRLYDRLVSRYGADRLFMDIDTIRPGHDFTEDIAAALSGSAVCLVLIGRRWESITLADGTRRLEDPTDFVRLEVAAAIREGLTVIPVLLEGALPPSPASLPEELQALSRRQAIELSSERWNYDVSRLALVLDEILVQPTGAPAKETPPVAPKTEPPKEQPRKRTGRTPALIAGAAVVFSLTGVAGWLASRGQDPTTATSPTGGPSSTSPSGDTTGGPCSSAPPSLPPSSGGRLSGSYEVRVTLECRRGELQGGSLWGERDPEPGVSGADWDSQTWVFSSTASGASWTFEKRNVFEAELDSSVDGAYEGTALGPPPICRSVASPAAIERDLYVSVTGTPDATAFEGWLVISWECDEPFVARFEVSGTQSGG